MNIVMTIAGSDSGGGAGIQADLKTFQELGVYGTSAVTALTAQNTLVVERIMPMPADFVYQQMEVVLRDMQVKVVKTGMLYNTEIIRSVAEILQDEQIQLVVDPVIIAKCGAVLLQPNAIKTMIKRLLPLATVVTPNIAEAEMLANCTIRNDADIKKAADKILQTGAKAVVMKGGNLSSEVVNDTVFLADGSSFIMQSERITTNETHGSGCTFAAAITAFLAQDYSIREAIIEAKKFVHLAIEHPLHIGYGHGPINHFAYRKHQCQQVTILE